MNWLHVRSLHLVLLILFHFALIHCFGFPRYSRRNLERGLMEQKTGPKTVCRTANRFSTNRTSQKNLANYLLVRNLRRNDSHLKPENSNIPGCDLSRCFEREDCLMEPGSRQTECF